MTATVATLGFPRIGPRRELKTALERYWSGRSDRESLLAAAAALRAAGWRGQQALGVDHIPSNDFSLYDHVLDTSVMVGAIPGVYGWSGGSADLDTYFAMARGADGEVGEGGCETGHRHGAGAPAAELTKWFDTNYHYLAPEFAPDQTFALACAKPVDEFLEAQALGVATRPVLLGPVTFLKLGKTRTPGFDPRELLGRLLPTYA
ncbi:MAG: 5-methyltetrahydropteroyltriglutamate--homocysteine S-methyltransferase, partial [Caulobacteraceae bacterium]